MVEVWHICSLFEFFLELWIQRKWLADFGDAILNVDILDMKSGVERADRGLLDSFEGFHHGVEKELDLLFVQLDSGRF